jgi:beta-glucosidase
MQHEGRLDFRKGDPAYDALLTCAGKPVIMTVYLDRPAILTNLQKLTTVLLGDFGINDDALLDLVVGKGKPEGHLPFELPSSMAEVEAQKSDLPHDTAHPLYPFGFALPQ